MTNKKKRAMDSAVLAVIAMVFIWSGINPSDRFTWVLEVFPVIIGAIVLVPLYKRFQFTTFTYVLMGIHAVILMVGGHYTYAEVPWFNWLRDQGFFERNNYDKIGHFAQGFIPAIIAREVLLRNKVLKRGAWLFGIVVSICLAISAIYELVEWAAAVFSGTAADAFLGTQGYVWDTQTDMGYALLGALAALLFFGRLHDRALARQAR